jgi:hypothetical protein
MKKQMERTVYEAPVTERFQVELEGSFCGSADVQNPDKDNGRIDAHKINQEFGDDGTFTISGWDEVK